MKHLHNHALYDSHLQASTLCFQDGSCLCASCSLLQLRSGQGWFLGDGLLHASGGLHSRLLSGDLFDGLSILALGSWLLVTGLLSDGLLSDSFLDCWFFLTGGLGSWLLLSGFLGWRSLLLSGLFVGSFRCSFSSSGSWFLLCWLGSGGLGGCGSLLLSCCWLALGSWAFLGLLGGWLGSGLLGSSRWSRSWFLLSGLLFSSWLGRWSFLLCSSRTGGGGWFLVLFIGRISR